MQISLTVLREFLNTLVSVLQGFPISSKQYNCQDNENAVSPINTETTRHFKSKLAEMMGKSSLLNLADESMVTYYLNLTIFKDVTDDEHLVPEITEIATVDRHHLERITLKPLNATKRFFRIGVAEVRELCFVRQHR